MIQYIKHSISHSDTLTNEQLALLNYPVDFAQVTPALINTLKTQIIEQYKILVDWQKSIPKKELSFETLFQPDINLDTVLSKAQMLISFPKNFHPDADTRQASADAMAELTENETKHDFDYARYQQFEFYYDTVYQEECHTLSPEKQKLVHDTLRSYRRRGMSLELGDRQKIESISQSINHLQNEFKQNINNGTHTSYYQESELTGMPQDWLSARRQSDGTIKVTTQYPDYRPLMMYCENREVRQAEYHHFNLRCFDSNTELLQRICILRAEKAVLLGYKTHADFQAEVNMVQDGKTISKFLDEMGDKFRPAYLDDIEALSVLARSSQGAEFDIKPWDIAFYSTIHKELYASVDEAKLKEYFSVEITVPRTLAIYQELLGLDFVHNTETPVWHPDVKAYEVYNRTEDNERGAYVGSFYLDLHPREGKYSHAAVFSSLKAHSTANITGIPGNRAYPVSMMACNFDKGQHMSFSEVRTFFHEFGHAMHNTCSAGELSAYAGISVQRDFVEAPSQMLENWLYNPQVLALISSHYQTDDPLPADMIASLKNERKHMAGIVNYRQNYLARLDNALHTMSAEDLKSTTLPDLEREIYYAQYGQPLQSCRLSNFGHLGGGYDARYYGYMWSKVIAQSFFEEVFATDPLSSEAGSKYRRMILAKGGTKEASELSEAFLGGRTVDPKHFFKSYGISEPAAKTKHKPTM